MADSLKPNCSSCGSSGSSGSEATPVSSTPCATAAESTCDCTPAAPASCSDEVPCVEDHTTCTVVKKFAYNLKVRNSFNWPADNEDVELYVQNVDSISYGTMLWNATIGYLYVQSFDVATQKIVARNKGDSCNIKTAGDLIPSCVEFVVGPVPCGSEVNPPVLGTPYLAADFTGQAEGICIPIKVTTISGLALSDIISIAGYQYRISEILDDETIVICNDGDGAPEGTLIEADSGCDGTPDIPIFVISSENPCSRDAVNAGVLIVCVDGVSSPIEGLISGQVLIWNDDTERWELSTVSLPEVLCTVLTATLTLDPGDPGPYLLTVSSTVGFLAGDVIQIGAFVYDITVIDDATHLHATPRTLPGVITAFPVNTPVCEADCCTVLSCAPEGSRFTIAPWVATQVVEPDPAPGAMFEANVSVNIFSYTAPEDCPGARYHLMAILNVAGLSNHGLGAVGPGTSTHELQISWANNEFNAGRWNWTDFGSDGVDITGAYPSGVLQPLWELLTEETNFYPIMYSGGYIVADTIIDPGELVLLKANYKVLFGDNEPPDDLVSTSFYAEGNLIVTRIAP